MPVAVQAGRGRAEASCPKSQTCTIMSEASVNPSPSRFGSFCECIELKVHVGFGLYNSDMKMLVLHLLWLIRTC